MYEINSCDFPVARNCNELTFTQGLLTHRVVEPKYLTELFERWYY
jgi:hypothetical protein